MHATDLVPRWVRIVAGLIALLNLAYGLLGYVAPGGVLPGLNVDTAANLNALHVFSARNMAIGIGMLIVAFRGVLESITIVMIIHLLAKVQDFVLSILNNDDLPAILVSAAFIAVELIVIVTMFRIVSERDKTDYSPSKSAG